jgi:creatinine amidohydrolase
MNKVWLSHLTWSEYSAVCGKGLVILPVGSTEQHNLHLPIGVDTIISSNLALDIAKSVNNNCFVAPPLAYGYKSQPQSGGGPHFPGSIDLKLGTLTNMLEDILRELLADGWKNILILNGHYENSTAIYESCDNILQKQRGQFPKIIALSWFDQIDKKVIAQVFDEIPFPGWELEHAAIAETSLVMYYEPDLVDADKMPAEGVEELPAYQVFPLLNNFVPPSGSMHTPLSSTQKKGALLAENVIVNIMGIISKEFNYD